MKGREQGEGKEKEMETSTLSGLSRQRWGRRERGAPDGGRGGALLSIASSTAPAGRLGFQVHFQGGSLCGYTITLHWGEMLWIWDTTCQASRSH